MPWSLSYDAIRGFSEVFVLSLDVTFPGEFVGDVLERVEVAEGRSGTAVRSRPVNGVLYDARDVLTPECRVFLVSGAEIEYLSEPAVIAAAAPENLSAGEPAYEDEIVRLRYLEALAVGFFLFELDVFGQTPRDRVGQLYYPDAFFSSFSRHLERHTVPMSMTNSFDRCPECRTVVPCCRAHGSSLLWRPRQILCRAHSDPTG